MLKFKILFALSLCTSFLFAQNTGANCFNAQIICSTETTTIEEVNSTKGNGKKINSSCMNKSFTATNGHWFKWQMETAGDLGFTLLPMDQTDDLDFVLYELNDGFDNCEDKNEIRCMASGENRGDSNIDITSMCTGATGLVKTSTDFSEPIGCNKSDDNFLSNIDVKKGATYALFVNNYHSSNGFILEFTGSAKIASTESHCQNNTEETTSINNIQRNGLFIDAVYPNPARSEIILPVISDNPFPNGAYQIISIHGQIIDNNSLAVTTGINEHKINIEELPIGVYFLKVLLGENIHITRFSKF